MLFKLARHLVASRPVSKRLYSTPTKTKMAGETVGVSLKTVLNALENFAPKELSENWDNTGLLVEPFIPRDITKILLTNDLTEDVAHEAHDSGCEMIVSYHPPIFAPLKSITQKSWKERVVSSLLERRIALYSPHTSWDAVQGGVNDWLASAFPVAESSPIIPGAVPNVGAGRLLRLKEPIALSEAVARTKNLTNLEHVRFALARGMAMTDTFSSIALCAGSGASVLKGVAAKLYLTGEMLHHDVLDATQKGISVILTNHSDSERGFLTNFSATLKGKLNNRVEVVVSKCDKDPLVTV